MPQLLWKMTIDLIGGMMPYRILLERVDSVRLREANAYSIPYLSLALRAGLVKNASV
jgi:hypothetical protein